MKDDPLHPGVDGAFDIRRHIIYENALFRADAKLFNSAAVNLRLRFDIALKRTDTYIIKILVARDLIPIIREILCRVGKKIRR